MYQAQSSVNREVLFYIKNMSYSILKMCRIYGAAMVYLMRAQRSICNQELLRSTVERIKELRIRAAKHGYMKHR